MSDLERNKEQQEILREAMRAARAGDESQMYALVNQAREIEPVLPETLQTLETCLQTPASV